MRKVIEIVDVIDTALVSGELNDVKSGEICVFVGAVREFINNEEVALKFETCKSMALKEMEKIADIAMQKSSVNKEVMRHAVGEKGFETQEKYKDVFSNSMTSIGR